MSRNHKPLRFQGQTKTLSLVPARLEGDTNADPTSPDYREAMASPQSCFVRLRRPDGTEKTIKVDGEQWTRVVDLASGEFGDPNIILIGPELPKEGT